MESRRTTQSVMGRLMGLDELRQPQKSIHKPQLTISENYRQRIASIGAGKKRLFHERHSVKELSHSGVMSASKSPSSSASRNVDIFRRSRRRTEFGYLEPLRKIENNITTDTQRNQLDHSYHDTQNTRIGVLKPIYGGSKCSERFFSTTISHSGVIKCTGLCVEQKERNISGCDVESIRQSSASREILEEFGRRTRQRGTKGSSLGFRGGDTQVMKPEFLTSPFFERLLVSDGQKQLSGWCSTTTNFERVEPGSAVRKLDELFATQGHVSRPRNHKPSNGRHGLEDLDLSSLPKQRARYDAFRSKWNLRSDKSLNWERINLIKHNFRKTDDDPEPKNLKLKSETSKSLHCSNSEDFHPYSDIKDYDSLQGTWARKDVMKNKLDNCSMYVPNMMLPNPSISTDNSVSVGSDMVKDAETNVAVNASEKSDNKHLESQPSTSLEEDYHCSSHATDGSLQQETPISFHEESSGFSHCATMEPDSPVILEETYQPSPISVLEPPFSEEAINGIEFLRRDDISDLGMHLRLLKSETSESDDESEEGLARESPKENEAFTKTYSFEENRNFLYLVEVITKASLHGKNLTDFSTWNSLECPISLSVFETLEKKYSDKISWTRSERRLLFDRINKGLAEILFLCTGVPGWKNSISRRFSSIRHKDAIEKEDLWKFLVGQEKECRESSGENAIGSELGKLELGHEIDAIGIEVERLLFDELLAELFSLA